MSDLTYQDFDLLLDGQAGAYRARLLDSPAGQAVGQFGAVFSPQELDDFFGSAGRLDADLAQQLGGRLFEAVFSGEIYACLSASLNQVRSAGQGLRLRLRRTAELHGWPWEYLYNRRLDRFLSLAVETPVVRYLELPQPPPALEVSLPLRILVCISSPEGLPALDTEAEWARLQGALAELERGGLVQVKRMESAALPSLQQRLRRSETHIFHFIGHGDFDEQSQDGQLFFEGPGKVAQPVNGQFLGTLLHNHRSLRLAVLNACEGARTGRTNPFAGVAHSLVQQGIPAVIAMQAAISDNSAIALAQSFYAALADGYPVDAALGEARTTLFGLTSQAEWGLPVYFTRAPEGYIFHLPDRPTRPEQQAEGPVPGQTGRATPASPPPVPDLAGQVPKARLFISYRRSAAADSRLAQSLHQTLTASGQDVFIDTTMRTGTAWLEEIDRQLKASDYLVVLLSHDSADSEMVQAEVRRAYEYRKQQGRPKVLPVRVAYEGMLPYSIEAFIDPLQYAVWNKPADDKKVAQSILAALGGRLPDRVSAPAAPAAAGGIISEDGRPLVNAEALPAPLPEFDPRCLQELTAPGGAVTMRDHFYIERAADARLKRELLRQGTTTTIRAARQTGKSSLLVRGVHFARSQAKIVHLDLQGVDRDHLESADTFLYYLAGLFIRKLRLDPAELEQAWRSSLGAQDKLSALMEDIILPGSGGLVVLALDEADRILETPFSTDFFALLRAWHNNRALDDLWAQLNIVMVISTEPYLLIADVNQSPFNVGLKLELEDFDAAQLADLNQRHGAPLAEADFEAFKTLLSGHPYLCRKALYTLATQEMSWKQLLQVATDDNGPFGDHLRRHHWLLRNEAALQEALRQVIRTNRCGDDQALFRLLRAGLVKGRGDFYTCRCDLYTQYFKDKLR
jgi:hypothetical protein